VYKPIPFDFNFNNYLSFYLNNIMVENQFENSSQLLSTFIILKHTILKQNKLRQEVWGGVIMLLKL